MRNKVVIIRLDGIYEIVITGNYSENDFRANFSMVMYSSNLRENLSCKMYKIKNGFIYLKEF